MLEMGVTGRAAHQKFGFGIGYLCVVLLELCAWD